MLVKLRMSNEKQWLEGGYDSNYSYEYQFREAYTGLYGSLENRVNINKLFELYNRLTD